YPNEFKLFKFLKILRNVIEQGGVFLIDNTAAGYNTELFIGRFHIKVVKAIEGNAIVYGNSLNTSSFVFFLFGRRAAYQLTAKVIAKALELLIKEVRYFAGTYQEGGTVWSINYIIDTQSFTHHSANKPTF